MIALALAGGSLVLAGCGGSSVSSSSAAKQASVSTASQTAAPATTGSSTAAGAGAHAGKRGGHASSARASNTSVTSTTAKRSSTAARHHGGSAGPNLAVPHGPNPCELVTPSQARAILGTPNVTETEAPLGPTCILIVKGRSRPITIAVEAVALAKLSRQMRQRHPVTVDGRAGDCGVLGQPMLDVSIAATKILNVTAPCTEAEALAAKAVPHLTA